MVLLEVDGMGMRKLMGFVGVLMMVMCLYPIILFYLEANYGKLDNLIVMDTYVPWIFHLMLIQFVCFIGIIILGGYLVFAFSGSEDEEKPEPRKKEKKQKKKRHEHKEKTQPKKKLKKQKKSEEKPEEKSEEKPGEEPIEVPPEWEEEEYE